MLRPLLVLTAALTLALPGPVLAAKPAPKPLKYLQLLVDEQVAAAEGGEVSADLLKAIKVGDRCMKDDESWARAMEDNHPISTVRELVQDAVACWQRAEKKAAGLGAAGEPSVHYFTARARYLESFRSYLWGVEAKLSSDRHSTCTRLKTAVQEAAASNEVAQGLAGKFATEPAQALGAKQDADAETMGNTILAEYQNQKCE